MTSLCHPFYMQAERRLNIFLFIMEVLADIVTPLSISTQSGIHTKCHPSEKWGAVRGLGGYRLDNGQDTRAAQQCTKKYSAVPKTTSYLLPLN